MDLNGDRATRPPTPGDPGDTGDPGDPGDPGDTGRGVSSGAGEIDGESRADASRARLMEAAVLAFADKGFHGTTTRDIASAAGMSPAALYVHHRSKEELLHLISRRGHEQTARMLREAQSSSPDPVVQLRRAVGEFVTHHARDHTVARVVNYELAALAPSHLAEIEDLRTEIDRTMRRIVAGGVAAGVFTCEDPRLAAAALLSMGIDVARWYREDGSWSPTDLGEHYADLALRMVGAPLTD